jgi:hypothetical protein
MTFEVGVAISLRQKKFQESQRQSCIHLWTFSCPQSHFDSICGSLRVQKQTRSLISKENLQFFNFSKSQTGKGGYLVSCSTECIQLKCVSAFIPTPLNQRGCLNQHPHHPGNCGLTALLRGRKYFSLVSTRDSIQQPSSYWPKALTTRLPATLDTLSFYHKLLVDTPKHLFSLAECSSLKSCNAFITSIL